MHLRVRSISSVNAFHNIEEFDIAAGAPVDVWRWRVQASSPERAILEALDELPRHASFDNLDKIFEGLVSLRPRPLTALLCACRSIKVRRLSCPRFSATATGELPSACWTTIRYGVRGVRQLMGVCERDDAGTTGRIPWKSVSIDGTPLTCHSDTLRRLPLWMSRRPAQIRSGTGSLPSS